MRPSGPAKHFTILPEKKKKTEKNSSELVMRQGHLKR